MAQSASRCLPWSNAPSPLAEAAIERSAVKGVLGLVQPLKGDYIRYDIRRVARWPGASYAPGDAAAFANVATDRAFWLIRDADAKAPKRFAAQVFRRHHVLGDSPRAGQALMAIAVATQSDVVDLPTRCCRARPATTGCAEPRKPPRQLASGARRPSPPTAKSSGAWIVCPCWTTGSNEEDGDGVEGRARSHSCLGLLQAACAEVIFRICLQEGRSVV